MNKDKLISIHLNSNKPKEFLKFIKSMAINTKEISNIEVIVSIDQKDLKMIKIINEINKEFPNLIRYIETDLIQTFADAWKPLNKLLLKTTDSVKYISCMSDNVRFKTKNWDQKILLYENHYKDNIFRIRCSKYRDVTYKDIWECGYKPDSYSFYTKKWLDIVGIWNPCIGPDSFQESISYYMRNFYGEQNDRNIIDRDIEFDGQEVSEKMSFRARIERSRIYYKAFFILMSYKMQSLANKKAYELVCKIDSKKIQYKKLNFFKTILTNFSRRFNFFYHRGSPDHFINSKTKNIIFFVWTNMSFLDTILIKFINYLYEKNLIKKIIKDEKKIKKIMKIIDYEKYT